jgi:DNA-binding CsgD family transcriptional regulator
MSSLWRRWSCSEKVKEYTNSQISGIIDEYIHSERDRKLLKRRLIDGITYERIAEEFDLSVRRTKTIVYRAEKTIFDHV